MAPQSNPKDTPDERVLPATIPPPRHKRRSVAVAAQMKGGRRVWVVTWWEAGRRRREFCKTKAQADEVARQRLTEDAEILEAIRAAGLTLRDVWERFQERAVSAPKAGGATVAAVLAEMLKAKGAAGRSSRYTDAVACVLGQFVRGREAAPIASITTADIEAHMARSPAGSRPTIRTRLSMLFRHAIRRRYIRENPVDAVEAIRSTRPTPTIMTVEQAGMALEWVRARAPRALGAFALSLLAGLRPEEAQGTTWAAVRLDAPDGAHVIVEAQTSKIRQRRVVYPMPAAVAWLGEAKRIGSELPLARQPWRRTIRKLAEAMGWAVWPKDVTRHTAASYWLAERQNAFEVAEQLGHSPGVLKTHYKALVTKAEAERFWALRPAGAGPADASRLPMPGATTPA